MSLQQVAQTDAELKLLSCIVAGSAPPDYPVYSDLRGEISPGMFLNTSLRTLATAIDQVVSAGECITVASVRERSGPEFDAAIASLFTYARSAHSKVELIPAYLSHLKEIQVPSVVKSHLDAAIVALESGTSPREVHEKLSAEMTLALEAQGLDQFIDCTAAANQVLLDLQKVWSGTIADAPFIPTQWPEVNALFGGGWYKKGMNIIAARPSIGKTALWEQEIVWQADEAGHGSIVIDLEMTPGQHLIRMAKRAGMVRSQMHEIYHPDFAGTKDHERLLDALEGLQSLPIQFIDKTRILDECVRRIYRRYRNWPWPGKPKFLVLDYIQLLRDMAGGWWSRTDEVGAVSTRLLDVAQDLDMVFIALAQLNRNLEDSTRLPRMSDIRECGQLEQDATNILFPHRVLIPSSAGEKNNDVEQTRPTPRISGPVSAQGVIGKARWGTPGVVPWLWDGDILTYRERGFDDTVRYTESFTSPENCPF